MYVCLWTACLPFVCGAGRVSRGAQTCKARCVTTRQETQGTWSSDGTSTLHSPSSALFSVDLHRLRGCNTPRFVADSTIHLRTYLLLYLFTNLLENIPFHFKAGSHKSRSNLALVFLLAFILCYSIFCYRWMFAVVVLGLVSSVSSLEIDTEWTSLKWPILYPCDIELRPINQFSTDCESCSDKPENVSESLIGRVVACVAYVCDEMRLVTTEMDAHHFMHVLGCPGHSAWPSFPGGCSEYWW